MSEHKAKRSDKEMKEAVAALAPAKPVEKPPLKIAILGTAPSSLQMAPFGDESWQIWGLSVEPHKLPRWDVWTEIHDLKRKRALHPGYYEYLGKSDKLVWLHQEDAAIPNGKAFPRQQVIDRFARYMTGGPDGFAYITNTISWLIGIAIIQIEANGGDGEIGLWGVDMAVGGDLTQRKNEYSHQRPSCEWMIGIAQGLGIKVHIPVESDLLKTRAMYGFDTDDNPMWGKVWARKREIEERKAQVHGKLEEADRMFSMTSGAIEEVKRIIAESNGDGTVDLDTLTQRIPELVHAAKQAMDQRNELQRGVAHLEGAFVNMDWIAQGCPNADPLSGID